MHHHGIAHLIGRVVPPLLADSACTQVRRSPEITKPVSDARPLWATSHYEFLHGRRCFVEGLDLLLGQNFGPEEQFTQAIEADPGFALAS